jgi:hypothetical protein
MKEDAKFLVQDLRTLEKNKLVSQTKQSWHAHCELNCLLGCTNSNMKQNRTREARGCETDGNYYFTALRRVTLSIRHRLRQESL